VVQGVGPEFKPQYSKTTTTTTKKTKIQTIADTKRGPVMETKGELSRFIIRHKLF
jgi:hypothetical protein